MIYKNIQLISQWIECSNSYHKRTFIFRSIVVHCGLVLIEEKKLLRNTNKLQKLYCNYWYVTICRHFCVTTLYPELCEQYHVNLIVQTWT